MTMVDNAAGSLHNIVTITVNENRAEIKCSCGTRLKASRATPHEDLDKKVRDNWKLHVRNAGLRLAKRLGK
jgi:hypothetical protein